MASTTHQTERQQPRRGGLARGAAPAPQRPRAGRRSTAAAASRSASTPTRASCAWRSRRSGAVLDLSVDGGKATPVVLKEAQRHPVRGETMHVDLLRVRLDEAIHAVVPLELTGVDDAPGVKEGGVLEQITRELNVEALPTAIPESIVHDVGEMQIGETILLARAGDARGRDAARRPRGDGRRDALAAAPADRSGRGNRGRDGARRRGRGGRRGRARAPAPRAPPARSSGCCDAPSVAVAEPSTG